MLLFVVLQLVDDGTEGTSDSAALYVENESENGGDDVEALTAAVLANECGKDANNDEEENDVQVEQAWWFWSDLDM